jgi:hypothetical protein
MDIKDSEPLWRGVFLYNIVCLVFVTDQLAKSIERPSLNCLGSTG